MKPIYLKPNLDYYFAVIPKVGKFLKLDYDNAHTAEALVDLVHKWFTDSDLSTNKNQKKIYKTVAYHLYSYITGRTFESKII